MADSKKPNNEPVADYSQYFQPEKPKNKVKEAPVSPLQDLPVIKKFTKRAIVLIVLLCALLALQVFLLLIWHKEEAPSVPEGYRLVTPPNQPAYIEPVK